MILRPGPPPPELNKQFETFAKNGDWRTTDKGIDYVATGELVGLMAGEVVRTQDHIELFVVMNRDVPKVQADTIVDISAAAERWNHTDRYRTANALCEILGLHPEVIDPDLLRLLRANYLSLMFDIENDNVLDPYVRGRIVREASSALGWLSMLRIPSDSAIKYFESFSEAGLWLPGPDEEVELIGANKDSGGFSTIKLMHEKSDRHTCAGCRFHILNNSIRLTVGLDKDDGYSDHHHYHPNCFVDASLPEFDINSFNIQPRKFQ